MSREVDLETAYEVMRERLFRTTEALILSEAQVRKLTGELEVKHGSQDVSDAGGAGGGDTSHHFSD